MYSLLQWWHRYAQLENVPRSIKRKVGTPNVESIGRLGYAPPPRGLVTRFYVHTKGAKHFVLDVETGGICRGTKQQGYETREEAVNVAEDLRDNRPRNTARTPF
jgi:hypothetical protein